jgi:hypothetical protein
VEASQLREIVGSELTNVADEFLAEMLGNASLVPKAKRKTRDGRDSPGLEVSRLDGDENKMANGHAVNGKKNVDDLLPTGVSLDGLSYRRSLTQISAFTRPASRKETFTAHR